MREQAVWEEHILFLPPPQIVQEELPLSFHGLQARKQHEHHVKQHRNNSRYKKRKIRWRRSICS